MLMGQYTWPELPAVTTISLMSVADPIDGFTARAKTKQANTLEMAITMDLFMGFFLRRFDDPAI
jgi:hypothetical protein